MPDRGGRPEVARLIANELRVVADFRPAGLRPLRIREICVICVLHVVLHTSVDRPSIRDCYMRPAIPRRHLNRIQRRRGLRDARGVGIGLGEMVRMNLNQVLKRLIHFGSEGPASTPSRRSGWWRGFLIFQNSLTRTSHSQPSRLHQCCGEHRQGVGVYRSALRAGSPES